jgi:hypothetical protein
LAVPKNTQVRYEFLTSAVVGQVLVPKELTAAVAGDTHVGDFPLHTGYHVTGTVKTQAGALVPGADVDVVDVVTGKTLFTPSDNTSTSGVFDVVVPAGTYDLDVTRPAFLVLVSVDVNDLTVVDAPVNLGVLTMRDGVFMTGTVRDHKGMPVSAADVNVFEVSTGLSIALSSDNTNAAGFYSVVVPTVMIDVVFSPPGPHNALAKDRHNDVNVTASLVLDGQFRGPGVTSYWPASGAPTSKTGQFVVPFSAGTSGTQGVPHIQAARDVRGHVTLFCTSGRPGAPATLLLGRSLWNPALLDHARLVRPEMRLSLHLDENGAARFPLPTVDATLAGLQAYAQLAVFDAKADLGVALSHVLDLTLP